MLMLDQLKEKSSQSVMLNSLGDLSSGREPLFKVGNLTRKSCHENCPLCLNGLSSNPFNLAREQAVERKRREQPIDACLYHTLASSLHFLSSLFFYTLNFLSYSYIPSFLPYFPLFSFLLFFSLVFPCSLLTSHCSSFSSCCCSLCIAKAFLCCLL